MAYIGNNPEKTYSINVKEYIATAGQTIFPAVYSAFVEVHVNGLLLTSTDYTATDGVQVILNVGATAGDEVRINGYADIATASGLVTSVAGRTGDVVLAKTDVGLGNVDNTSDVNKPVSTAQATAIGLKQDTLVSGTNIKTINGADILGSGNLVITDDAKLPLSGGTMTGAITSLKETSVSMGANNIDLATGNLFTKTITTATTLTVSNVPAAGQVGYMILQLTNGGSAAVTWFSGVKWAGGTAPTLTASGKDILSFYTIDAGTTWNIVSIQKDVK